MLGLGVPDVDQPSYLNLYALLRAVMEPPAPYSGQRRLVVSEVMVMLMGSIHAVLVCALLNEVPLAGLCGLPSPSKGWFAAPTALVVSPVAVSVCAVSGVVLVSAGGGQGGFGGGRDGAGEDALLAGRRVVADLLLVGG